MPARRMARCGSGLAMNHCQTLRRRRFSALSRVTPTSSPSVSVETHPDSGLKASARPYRPEILVPYLSFMACRAARQMSGMSISEPAAAHGTTVPSILPCGGGPPQAAYPLGLEELVMPQIVAV